MKPIAKGQRHPMTTALGRNDTDTIYIRQHDDVEGIITMTTRAVRSTLGQLYPTSNRYASWCVNECLLQLGVDDKDGCPRGRTSLMTITTLPYKTMSI
jgi:hypothetical protein